MKNRSFYIFSMVFLLLAASIACSLFVPKGDPTESPDDYDFGPTGGPLKFTPDTLPEAQVGSEYEATLQVTLNNTPVGDFFISEGALPEGLEFTFLDGEDAATITGAPTEAGEFKFTVTVWCFGTQVSGQTGEMTYTLTVNP